MKRFLVFVLVIGFCFSGMAKTTKQFYDGNVVVEYWGNGEKEYPHIRVYISKKWAENFGDDYQVYLVYKYPGVTFTTDADGNCMLPEGISVKRTKWHVFYYNNNKKAGYKVFEMHKKKGLIPLYLAEEVKDLKDIVFLCCPYYSNFDGDMRDYFTVVIAKKDADYKEVLSVLAEEGRSICNTGDSEVM